jgi:2-keto-4-pentenoate hydratase/2-oxohepta-3-ene-1,7-dioic acid hydratase in catechol pathway
MKLVTIDVPVHPRTGALIGDDVLDFALASAVVPLAGFVPEAMPALLAGGDGGLDLIRCVLDTISRSRDDEEARLRKSGALKSGKEVRLLAPNPRPGIVLSHGRAYHSHLKEMAKGEEKPKVTEEPRAFLKNASSITGPGSPIVLPRRFPDMVDFEGEFSVVFGRDCYDVAEKDAMGHVAGYTIINDVSARNWVEHFVKTNDPDLNRQGKQLPTFCPIGPVIVTRDEIPDPHDVNLTTRLNGKVMQSAHTSDLIWTLGYLISYFSSWYHFRPGDILTTGSPAGVGYARDPKVFMKPGDVVAITVDRVGTLSNPVVAASG